MVIEEMRSPGDSEATQIRATTGSQAHSHICRIDGKDSVIGTQKLRLAAGPTMEMQPLPETSQDGEREGRKYPDFFISPAPSLPTSASDWTNLPRSQRAREPGKCSPLCYGA